MAWRAHERRALAAALGVGSGDSGIAAEDTRGRCCYHRRMCGTGLGPWIQGIALLACACEFGSQTGGSGQGTGDGGSEGTAAVGSGSEAGPSSADGVTAMPGPDDGGTAAPTGSCADGHGGCDPNASCDDESGTVMCTCNAGFAGDGFTCAPEAVSLRRLHYENPCTGTLTEACPWENFCVMADTASDSASFTAEAGVLYRVTLHFRGLVSQIFIEGGTTDGLWNEGGTPMPRNPFQPVILEISDPPQQYFLNAGPDQAEYCIAVDYTREVEIAAGAEVTVGHYDTNACSVINRDPRGNPVVVEGVELRDQPYDGQFFQVDFVSARAQG